MQKRSVKFVLSFLRNHYTNLQLSACFSKAAADKSKNFGVVCETYGESLKLKQDLPSLTLNKNEIRIASHTSSLTFADLLMCQGKYQIKPPTPFIAGREVCGQVLEVGEDVKLLRKGDKVFGFLPEGGGFTNEVVLPKQNCFVIPQSMDYKIGSAMYTSYLTAYLGLVHRAQIKPSDKVLITGAGGAVGLAAVDLCANVYKSKVIGVTGSAEKSQAIRDKGAFATIEYEKEKIKESVSSLTNKKGVDIAFDTIGGHIFEDCLKSLSFDGRLLVVGFASGQIPDIKANYILVKSNTIIGYTMTNYFYRKPELYKQAFEEITKLWEQNIIEPVIAEQTFSLNQINDAVEYIKGRKAIGKVIITLEPPQPPPEKIVEKKTM